MSRADRMHVLLRLPRASLYDGPAVALSAVAQDGAFGLLPNHRDYVAVLIPSILSLRTPEGVERVFGIDEAILVKKGHRVEIAARRGVEGRDLASLRTTVREAFAAEDDDERAARTVLARLEVDMARRFGELRRPRP